MNTKEVKNNRNIEIEKMPNTSSFKKYLPNIVYGGSDGAVSYFTLMAGAYGAGMPIKMLIAIGVSNVAADAFSMASADYLSEDSKGKTNKKESLKKAFATFISFILLGCLPLAPTFYAFMTTSADSKLSLPIFLASTFMTFIGFTYIGYLRGTILRRPLFKTILQSAIICSTSAAVAYFIGEYVTKVLM